MSNVIGVADTLNYVYKANSYKYLISYTLNTSITLPDVINQDNEITIINEGNATLTVKRSDSSVIGTLEVSSFMTVIPNPNINNWSVVARGSSGDFETNNFLSPIIPILVDNAQANNNQFFGADASSSGGGTQPFQPFSTGGTLDWRPNTAGAEFLKITAPYPFVARAVLLQLRGANATNYFNLPILQGSNNNTNWVNQYTYTLSQAQSTATSFSKFENTVAYLYYRISIPASVGTVGNLGIFNMQLYGYYLE